MLLSLIINHQSPCPVTLLAKVLRCVLLFCSVLFASLDCLYFWYRRSLWVGSEVNQINVWRFGKKKKKLLQNFQRQTALLLPFKVFKQGHIWIDDWWNRRNVQDRQGHSQEPWTTQLQDVTFSSNIHFIEQYQQTAADYHPSALQNILIYTH